MTLFDLSGFQRDLLTVIAGHDQSSGQQIKTDLEDARTVLKRVRWQVHRPTFRHT